MGMAKGTPYPLCDVLQERTAELAEGQGIVVVTVTFEERPYLAWLARRREVHSDVAIGLWATERGFEILAEPARIGEADDGVMPPETSARP